MTSFRNLLLSTSTKKFYIQHNDFRVNHIAHGIFALHCLGASTERIERWVDWYIPKLEPASRFLNDAPEEARPADLLGKRKGFYKLVHHFEKAFETTNKSIYELVRQEFPLLANGLIGSSLHPLIQLGYGIAAGVDRVVIEGLAHMHVSYVPLNVSQNKWKIPLGTGTKDIVEIIQDIREDTDLRRSMLEHATSQEWTERVKSKFQQRVGALFTSSGERLVGYINQLRFPPFYDPQVKDMKQVIDLARWLVEKSLLVYVKSENKNDFFILHGVTAAWSLLQTMSCLQNYDQALNALQVYMCALLAAYMAQDTPALTVDLNPEQSYDESTWQTIIKDAIKDDIDEHIYKLVQVAYDMNKCAETDTQRHLYACSARMAVDTPIFMLKY